MAQQVRALAALAEDPDLAPSIHMESHNHLIPAPGDPAPSSGLCRHSHTVHIRTRRELIRINSFSKREDRKVFPRASCLIL